MYYYLKFIHFLYWVWNYIKNSHLNSNSCLGNLPNLDGVFAFFKICIKYFGNMVFFLSHKCAHRIHCDRILREFSFIIYRVPSLTDKFPSIFDIFQYFSNHSKSKMKNCLKFKSQKKIKWMIFCVKFPDFFPLCSKSSGFSLLKNTLQFFQFL